MMITRREGFPSTPVAAGTVRSAGAKRVQAQGAKFDHIILSAGRENAATFRDLAASLSQQVRTFNTTGKIQDLRQQVASGEYRPDARETAARMLLLSEGE